MCILSRSGGLLNPLIRVRLSRSLHQTLLRPKVRISSCYSSSSLRKQDIITRCCICTSASLLASEQPDTFYGSVTTTNTPKQLLINSEDNAKSSLWESEASLDPYAAQNVPGNEKVITELLQESSEKGFLSKWFGWAPDLVQSLLENIHDMTGFPWWVTIIAGTICLRTMSLPVIFYSKRNSKRMAKISDQVVELNEKLKQYYAAGEGERLYETRAKIKALYKEHNVHPLGSLAPMFGQGILISCFFFAIRQMANAPVEGFSNGGLLWFSNLSIPDPYFILPAINFAILTASSYLNLSDIEVMETMKRMLLVMYGGLFFVSTQFPSGLCIYLIASATYTLMYGIISKLRKMNSEEKKELPDPLKPKKTIQTGNGKRIVRDDISKKDQQKGKSKSKKHHHIN